MTSADLGDLAPAEGTAITYYWNPLYNLVGLLPWLLIAMVLVLLKENRRGSALCILLPVIFVKLLWFGLSKVFNLPSEVSAMFVVLIDGILVGFVLNWLLAERIGNRNRFVTWLLALLVFLVAYGVSLTNIGFSSTAMQISIFLALTAAILLVSFPLAGVMCRRKFGPVKFSVWMAVWVLITSNVFFMSFALIQLSLSSMSSASVFLQVLMVTMIYAGILIVGLLPFEIVLFANGFWRKRFEAVFGLRVKTVAVESIQADEPSESKMPAAEE